MAGAAFANPLAVTVTPNDPLEPVNGGVVNFAVATAVGGAAAALSAATAIIVDGGAAVTATANLMLGSYTATASAAGAGQFDFSLTNTQPYSLVVTTTQDLPLETDRQNSLRAAIDYADTLAGPSTITFDPAVFGTTPQTITLIHGELTLSNTATITIVGPGAELLTVNGGGESRVFDIEGGSAALEGLTISGGNAASVFINSGGGIRDNGGTLTLADCTVSGNSAAGQGGGLQEYGGTLSLTDCTVSGNSAPDGGGGLCESNGTLSLTDCTVSGNSAPTRGGGGLYNVGGTATLTNCTISTNTAFAGGGLSNGSNARTTLTDCSVSSNSASQGGGLLNEGTLGTTDCTISANSAGGGEGGGLRNDGSTTLTGCTVSGNTAADGGGLFNRNAAGLNDCTVSGNTAAGGGPGEGFGGGLYNSGGISLTNCTLSGNTATHGGGLGNVGGNSDLIDCTVSGNTAGGSGGAGNYGGGLDEFGTNPLTLTNTIVAGNGGGGGASDIGGQPFASGSYDLIGTGGSGGLINGADHNIVGEAAPMLGKLGNYGGPTQTIPLLPGSPAIGGGTIADYQHTSTPITTDQRGKKLDSPTPDIGAFQSQGFTVIPVTGSSPQTAAPSPTPSSTTAHDVVLEFYNLASLRAAIAYANNHAGPATITFDSDTPGTKHRTIRLTGGPLVLTDPATTTIIGPGARLLTFSGEHKSRVFDIQGGSLALSGVSIADGEARRGGGILNDRGTLALDHVVLRGNRARVGGGLFNNGTTTITDVALRGNTAGVGSGMFSTRNATLTRRGLVSPVSTRPIVVDHFNGKGGISTNWKQFSGQPGDVVEKLHHLTITDSTGTSAGIVSTARTVPFNPVGVKTTIVAQIHSLSSNGNAFFGLIGLDAQYSPAGYLAAGIDAHGNVFVGSSIAPTLGLTPKLIGLVKNYRGKSITLTFIIKSTGVAVHGGGFQSGLIPFTDLSNFSLAAAFPGGNARPALGAASRPNAKGGRASFGSINVVTA
jgi:hypothetical protein